MAMAAYHSGAKSLQVKGHDVVLDPTGALYIPDLGALIIADLHFEKGSSYARQGRMIPPYDTSMTLLGLEKVFSAYRPDIVVSLGDAFHDREAERRMSEGDAARLEAMCTAAEWYWVLGNHDPRPPMRFSGTAQCVLELTNLVLVHEPDDAEGWSLAGHLHPCALISQKGFRVRRPCFLLHTDRMILPAFGAYTGGLNVLDEAFAECMEEDADVHILGQSHIYQIPRSALRPDQPDWYNKRKALR